jgi:small subunit ribosomal protein S20
LADKNEKKPLSDTEKRHRQSLDARARNRHYKSTMRTEIKKFRQLVEDGKVEEAQAQLHQAVSVIQRTAQKGVIHRGQASRRVSRLTHAFNGLKSQG